MREAPATRVGTLAALWLLLIVVESGAQIGLKIGSAAVAALPFGPEWVVAAAGSPWVLFGGFCYVLAFVFWMLILDKMELSLAFPLTGMIYIVVLLVSAYGLHEKLTPFHWAGVALIIAGVYVLGRDDA